MTQLALFQEIEKETANHYIGESGGKENGQ